MVPDNSTGIPRAPAYSGGGYGSTWLRVPDSHRLRSAFPDGSARSVWPIAPLLLPRHVPCDTAGLGSSPFARRYWGNRCYFLFLQVLRCFSSLRSPRAPRGVGIAPDGLPHSDICGSKRICRSPQLFAACHVLLRLREPRHPPCALLRSVLSFGTFVRISLPWFARVKLFVVFLLLSLADSRSDSSKLESNFQPCQCSLLKWRITDSNR